MTAFGAVPLFGFHKLLHCPGQVRVAKDFPDPRRFIVWVINPHARWVLLELLRTRDRSSESRTDWKTVLSQINGRRQDLHERHRSPFVQHGKPGIDDAWNGAGQQS